MTDNELYWLAGWLEGEGSFGVLRQTGYRYPEIQVSSTDRDVLEKAVKIVGWGLITGPRPVRKPTHNPIYILMWRRSVPVRDLMRLLYPLMCERRQRQIDAVFEEITPILRPSRWT